MRNIKAVLGPNPLLWCWPAVPPGDGLSFEIVQGKLNPAALPTLPILTYTLFQMGSVPGSGHLKTPLRGWTKTTFSPFQKTRGHTGMDLSTQTFILVPQTVG